MRRELSLAEKLKNRLMRDYEACVMTGVKWTLGPNYYATVYKQHIHSTCKVILSADTELEVVVLAYKYIVEHKEEFI